MPLDSYACIKYLVVTLWLWSVCPALSAAAPHTDSTISQVGEQVYVVSHGWHSGFVVSARAIQDKLPQLRERFGDTPFIELGWGDFEFYQAKEMTPGMTLKALFWPTESVVHAVAVPAYVEKYFYNSRIERLCLSEEEYLSLLQFITESFHKNDGGELTPLKPGLYGNSQFYKGTGDFHLMNTCNKWTAKGLKSMGMDISTTFKLTAGSVMDYLHEYNQINQNELHDIGSLNNFCQK